MQYTKYGNIAKNQIEKMADYYDDIKVEKYVIMPNHIHLLFRIVGLGNFESKSIALVNSRVSRFVGTFKRFCNREYGRNIWQRGSNDHVIRGEEDYRNIWEYIENNPLKWKLDIFWSE